MTISSVWQSLRDEASAVASRERILAKVLTEYVLEAHFTGGCSELETFFPLGKGHGTRERLEGCFSPPIGRPIDHSVNRADLEAVKERDPACDDFLSPFLYFKGFQALSAFGWHIGSGGRVGRT